MGRCNLDRNAYKMMNKTEILRRGDDYVIALDGVSYAHMLSAKGATDTFTPIMGARGGGIVTLMRPLIICAWSFFDAGLPHIEGKIE